MDNKKKYGKNTKKQQRKDKIKSFFKKYIAIIMEIFLVILIVIVGMVSFYNLKKQEKEQEKAYIESLIQQAELSEAEHQVDIVEEPVPVYIYIPREEQYYIDLELLAHLIYSEVGDDGEEAMYYAGSVVLNRMKNHEYPDDLYSVIYQKGQYEVTWNGGLYKEEPSDIAYEVAADLLEEGSILPEGVVYQAEFRQGSGTFEIIGNTYFCYQ